MPEQPTDPQVVFVDDPAEVRSALDPVTADVVGVDVERADADRYFRRAALVQVGVEGRCLLLDAVTLGTLPDLDAFAGPGRLVVLHALENDVEPLARKGVHPDRLADTAVAAGLLGLPTGLSALLSEVLGIQLSADKERFQRADWEVRPLPDDMAAYAAGDVVHLPELWAELADRLEATGRTSWYEQELVWTVARAADDNRDWTRVKGAGRLDPQAKAVLKALWDERERIARAEDIAPNRLVHDEVLRDLAEHPARSVEELVRRSPRRRGLLRTHAAELLEASDQGRRAEPESRDGGGRRWSNEDRAAYDAMRRARAEVATELELDAGIVCPSRPLWRAVAGRPADAGELCALAELRPWQAELLGEVLWDAYTASGPRRPAPVDTDEGPRTDENTADIATA
jgi:ribonuclease D